MKPFKFFQKGTLVDQRMMEMETRATAAFNSDTPEGHYGRRRLYHTDRGLYDRLNNPTNNNEMERYYHDRDLYDTQQEVTRRINGGTQFFTGTSTATKVNPKWWMKIKIFFQEQFWFKDPAGVIAIAAGLTIFVILSIGKLLRVW